MRIPLVMLMLALAAATAFAGSAAQPDARATTQPGVFAPFRFIHAGDPELGSPDLPGSAARLNQVIDRANARQAALIVFAGDMAHHYTPEVLDALDAAIARLALPAIAVPGNHDMADLAAYRKRFGPENAVHTVSNCDFVCVNSESLRPAVLEWLDRSLAQSEANKRTHVFVAIHRPPEAGDAVGRIIRKHRVSAVLAGHLHKTGQSKIGECPVYWVSGSAKFRDDGGLCHNVFHVTADRVTCQTETLPAPPAPATQRD